MTAAILEAGKSSRRLNWAHAGWPKWPSQEQGRERPNTERSFEARKAVVAPMRKRWARVRSR